MRLGTYSPNAQLPPAAVISRKAMSLDPRSEPLYAERVRYVVVHGPPGSRLTDMVVPPQMLLAQRNKLRLHAHYYISKQMIPALERIFHLIGVDVRTWYADMRRSYRAADPPLPALHKLVQTEHQQTDGQQNGALHHTAQTARHTIDAYYHSSNCAVCGALDRDIVCSRCQADLDILLVVVLRSILLYISNRSYK